MLFIQPLLDKFNEEQINKIYKKICDNAKNLCIDEYGNYLIQCILKNNKIKNIELVYEKIKGKIFEFSLNKFASNVIEQCLVSGNEKLRKNIINEIIILDSEKKDSIFILTKSKFGNYVVQKMIEFSDENTRKNIIDRILSLPSKKKNEGFTKHVIKFIKKIKGQPKYQDNKNNFK